jgi:hypothetical protein
MALKISTLSPAYDLTMLIDNEPVRVHVQRLSRDLVIALRQKVADLEPRGTVEETDAQRAARTRASFDYAEECIRAYVTFEPGDVTLDDGTDVVTGDQIVQAFYNRQDVLDALASAVYAENCLGAPQKKILKSSRRFSPGSTPSIPSPAGGAPVSTAGPADEKASVPDADVTALPDAAAAGEHEV